MIEINNEDHKRLVPDALQLLKEAMPNSELLQVAMRVTGGYDILLGTIGQEHPSDICTLSLLIQDGNWTIKNKRLFMVEAVPHTDSGISWIEEHET